jgi:hypothetical protein
MRGAVGFADNHESWDDFLASMRAEDEGMVGPRPRRADSIPLGDRLLPYTVTRPVIRERHVGHGNRKPLFEAGDYVIPDGGIQ